MNSRILLALLLLGVASFGLGDRRAAAHNNTSSTFCSTPAPSVVIHAAGRGNPYINFEDGVEIQADYTGPVDLRNLLTQNVAEPRALASADFDEDGVPDLICGYARSGGGIISLYRGNVDSIFPNSPEAQRRRAEGTFTDSAFLSPARVFDAPAAADFVGAGDFDADGHWDVVIAARGGKKLYLLSGDGKGNFLTARKIALPGDVSSMVTGEINRADGLTDVVVGVVANDGAKVLVFEGPEGALKLEPEVFSVSGEPKALALGQFDDDYPMDLAVGAGSELVIIHGRDWKVWSAEVKRGDVNAAKVERWTFGFKIESIAAGDFPGSHNSSFALLASDGLVSLFSTQQQRVAGNTIERAKPNRVLGRWPGASQLTCARLSTGPSGDLLITGAKDRELHICKIDVGTGAVAQAGENTESLELDGAFAAALAMRLNRDALSDLVILRSGNSAPAIVKTASAKTFVVNSADDHDDGSCDNEDCTLREALNAANSNPGADTIAFNIQGAAPHTIAVLTSLPSIDEPATIDGTTQPGFLGLPVIELRGKIGLIGIDKCLQSTAGRTVIRGFVINHFRTGMAFAQSGGNLIEGNLLGTDSSGTSIESNDLGIVISSRNNVVGGTTAASRNIISGSRNGIQFLGDLSNFPNGNLVQGNFIGTDATGTTSLGNSDVGVQLSFARDNTIGGVVKGARNVISGNRDGVSFFSGGGNLVLGNYIGIDVNRSLGVPNLAGITIGFGSSNNTIGGANSGAGNTVAFNNREGILDDNAVGNTFIHNSIFSNGGLGIKNGFDRFNDPCDLDDGPNHLQNFPVVGSVLSSGLATTVRGILNSTPGTSFTIELFANDECDPSGFGEGKTYIASTTVTTGADCNGAFNVTLPVARPAGQFITATATDPDGNTSEFSQCIQVQQGTTFDRCLQDDSNGNILLINSTTGEYQFSNCRGVFLSGVGSLLKKGCLVTLQVNGPDRRIQVRLDTCSKVGSASIQLLSQGTNYTITDRNTSNDPCVCAGPN